MAGYGIRAKAERLQQSQSTQAYCTYCRLSHVRGTKRIFLQLLCSYVQCLQRIDAVGEERGVRGSITVIGCCDGGEYLRIAAGEITEHAGVLCPLAREEDAELSGMGCSGEKRAVRCLPSALRVFTEHCLGIGDQRRQVCRLSLDYQRQPAGGSRFEGGSKCPGPCPKVVPGEIGRQFGKDLFQFASV